MKIFISIIIAFVAVAGQHFLSSRKNPIFGCILPVILTALTVWIKVCKVPSIGLRPFIMGIICLLLIWAEGRDNYKKKINKELDKMKSKDII